MSIVGGGQSTELLFEVVRVLNERNVQYAVIGAMAVSVHGVVRASIDADAVVALAITQFRELGNALSQQGFKIELRQGDVADPIPAMLVIADQYENRVDLLMGLRGLDSGIYERAVEIRPPGLSFGLRVASKEDVIAMKLFAGGPLDLLDAKRLVAVAGGTIDLELLRRLVARFGKEAITNYESLMFAK